MTLSHSPNIVRDGLVLYLDAANPKSYPGSGTTWHDLSGNSLNGTLNSPTYNSINQKSMVFDGVDDLVLLPSGSSVFPLQNLSWQVVFKSPGLGASKTQGGLFCPNYGMVSYINNQGRLTFTIYDGSSTALSMSTPSGVSYFDNEWHIASFILNGSYGYIYVDGQLKQTTATTISNRTGTNIWASMSMRLGDNPNNSMYDIYGEISGLKFYNKGLSYTEVVQNFNALRGRYGL